MSDEQPVVQREDYRAGSASSTQHAWPGAKKGKLEEEGSKALRIQNETNEPPLDIGNKR